MSEREAELSSPSWCSPPVVFQRVGVSRQRADWKHTPEVMRGLPRKSVGTERERGAFVGSVEPGRFRCKADINVESRRIGFMLSRLAGWRPFVSEVRVGVC